MLTRNYIKLIKSLSRKKGRDTHGLFVVEGYKSIQELYQSGLDCKSVFVTTGNHKLDHLELTVVTEKEMKTISNLTTPPGYLAVFEIPKQSAIPHDGGIIVLDGVKDPGNLGTIIRLADWYGVSHIVCSRDTVDLFNPKCIQATMSSIARVQVYYRDIKEFLSETQRSVYIAHMEGESLYSTSIPENAAIVMGSESHGVSDSVKQLGTPVSIPSHSTHGATESLNVAIAAAIITAHWKKSLSFTGK
ncbi:MAG: RNA methyltransferase [Bacteroidota bacterium]|nr:RNA methyltransferase [Bacteroidota bacterium]